jgi:hypothetical protein
LEEARSFVDSVKYIIDWLDAQAVTGGQQIVEPSFELLQKLAMQKLSEHFPDNDVFREIKKSEIIFENELLFEYKILKKDKNAVTFSSKETALTVFGSLYLIKNCEKLEVIDLIIEMISDDEEYRWMKRDIFGTNGNIILFILKDHLLKEIYAKRLTENEGNLQRIFLKGSNQKFDWKILLILAAFEHGDSRAIKKIIQETNQNQETCLHRLARNSELTLSGEFYLTDFLKAIAKKPMMIDDFDEWLLKKDSDGKTFLFYLKHLAYVEKVFNFFKETRMDENSIGKLLLEKDKNGETFLFNRFLANPKLIRLIANITDIHYLRELLISENYKNENFLKTIHTFGEFAKIIGCVREIFPHDFQLFKSLLNVYTVRGCHFLSFFSISFFFICFIYFFLFSREF